MEAEKKHRMEARRSLRTAAKARFCDVIETLTAGLATVAFSALALACVAGVLAILLFSYPQNHYWNQVGVALALACASMVAGSLAGFLFGIPRTFQSADDLLPKSKEPEYRPNTNLEQISDWLTKIMVGVGLTQLSKIPGRLWSLAQKFAPGLGNHPGSPSFALSLIIFFSVAGFLVGYMWTRIYFRKVLMDAEREPGISKADLDKKVEEVDFSSATLSAALGAAGSALALPDNHPRKKVNLQESIQLLEGKTDHLYIRTVAIFLGRLYRQIGNLEAAEVALGRALDERRKRGMAPNSDDGDIFYNRACYLNLRARECKNPDEAAGSRRRAVAMLGESFPLNLLNVAEAVADPDLSDLIEQARTSPQTAEFFAKVPSPASPPVEGNGI